MTLQDNIPRDSSQDDPAKSQIQHNPATPSVQPSQKTGLEKAFGEYVKKQEELTTKNKADALGIPYINLIGYPIKPETLVIIPKEIAEKYQMVAFLKAEGRLRVATVDAKNYEMRRAVSGIAAHKGLELYLALASPSSIKYALENYKLVPAQPIKTKELEISKKAEVAFEKEIKSLADLKEKITGVSTTKVFDIILAGAVKTQASDIHIEPTNVGMRLRYRIDGVLQDVTALPVEAYRALLSRIKYLAKMMLDIKDKPQNGRFSITAQGKPIDLRVSTLPTVYGENIVMRLLAHGVGFLNLDQLGFSNDIKALVSEAISRPAGLIINSGPTGSGKTTTLYAILDYLNKPGKKIITLEDPVEYRIPGVTQTQIQPDKGLDFANGLKNALRQDPDILMVGEIRDLETAEAAISAGMTGHLVLTTLHTNNAVAAMPRLMDMGVKPFLLSGNILLVMAQRLVRKICDACKAEYSPKPEVSETIRKSFEKSEKLKKIKIPDKLWQGRGCQKCNNTGFSGRLPIAEALKPVVEFEKMVQARATISELYQKAIELGMITMEQDGLRKVIAGVTTIEEVWRVTAAGS